MNKSYFGSGKRLNGALHVLRLAGTGIFLLAAIGAFLGWVMPLPQNRRWQFKVASRIHHGIFGFGT